MSIVESFHQIRSAWIGKVSNRLAKGSGVRESFRAELNRFYDLLLQAVETGDPAWMNSILDEWVEARTQTELENRETSLPPILDQILMATYEVAFEGLSESEALELVGAVLPVYTHSFEYTTQKETNLHIEHISGELEKARLTLEKLDKSKSDFISIAAHELRTPLTLIEGYADMLIEQLTKDDHRVKLPVLLKGIDNGTRRLREIVDDMIDVSMIDNNMLSLNFQPVWLNRIFSVIEQEFREDVTERKLKFTVRAFPGSDLMIFADAERLFQAFRNIISNAIKFTPDGGTITVDGRLLPGFIEIIVSDTGIGVDPEYHLLIFEKFGRLGNASLHSSGKTKFKGGGPGLGLPITKGIIEAHSGAIWVESEGYNEETCPGTIFHILLPQREEPPDEKIAKLFSPAKKSTGGLASSQVETAGNDISGKYK